MCQTIIYRFQGRNCRVSCNDVKAKIPLLTKTGMTLLPWGRSKNAISQLPIGKWVPLHDIRSSKWDAYFPKPVKLPIQSFLVRDEYHNNQWFHLPTDKWIQGLLARYQQDLRVYIVILDPSPSNPYSLWPRILVG